MSGAKRPWASLEDRWSDDETWAEFGDVVRAASGSLTRFDATGYGEDFWKELVVLGWQGAFVAETHGGLGLGSEAIAEIVAPLAVSGCSHAYLATAVEAVAVLQSLPTEYGDSLLAQMGAGDLRLHVALAESAKAPYPEVIITRAERTASGWVLNGRKTLVPYAQSAHGLIVLAAESGTDAPILLHVPIDTDGLTLVPQDSVGIPLADVVLDNITVPDEAHLGSGSAVQAALESVLDLAVALDAVALVGIGSEALALALQYTGERVVFDKPLDTLQAVQQHCATAFLRVEQARVLARDALLPREDTVERAWASSLAAVKAGEGIIEVLRVVHRIHGGIGFYDDYPLAGLTRRALAIQGLHGSIAWHRGRLQDLLAVPDHVLERTVLRTAAAV